MDVDNKMKSIVRITFILILILYVLYLLSNLVFHKSMEPEMHLIPKGYTGKVYVFFNVKGYEKIKYDNGVRIYEIPPTGILLTSSSKNTGWIDADKYLNFKYRSGDKFLNKFMLFDSLQYSRDSLEVCVFDYGYGKRSGFKLDYSSLSYTVDTLKNINKRDTYMLRKSIIKSQYPDLDI